MATKRRMNGEGSWTERNNGSWKLSVSYKGFGRKYFYGTKQECLKKKREFEALISSGATNSKDVMFKDFARAWLVNIKKPTIKPTTYDRLEYIVEHNLIENIGNLSLTQIDDYIIQNYIINKMKTDGQSYGSIKLVYSAMNTLFKYALQRNKISKNPLDAVELPKKSLFTTKKITCFSKDERDKFVAACYSRYPAGPRIYRYGAFYVFMLYSGCRLGEALSLKWKDIDLENRQAKISKTFIMIKNRSDVGTKRIQVEQPTTKTGKPRTIFLTDMAIEALQDLAKLGNSPDDYIVLNRKGGPVRIYVAQKIYEGILKKAGIDHCGVHTLRHSFVSLMLNNDIPITMISEMVGHSNINITMQVYSHLLQETRVESMAIMKNLK